MRKLLSLPWWVYLAACNLLFVTLTVAFGYLPDFPLKWRLFNPFNLGLEMNLAAWYSSILLLALSLLARELSSEQEDFRSDWMILAFLFAVLSFDEMGSLHERLGYLAGDIAYLPLALLGGFLFLVVFLHFWRAPAMRRTAVFLLIGFVLMASAAPQEYLEHRINWPTSVEGIRLGLEEGLELAGMFFCFAALIPQRLLPVNNGAGLVPDPTNIPLKQKQFWMIIVSQIVISFWVVNFIEVENRGDPALWIPSALFFYLFSLAFWQWWEKAQESQISWGLISLLSLFLSVAVLYSSSPKETSVLIQLFDNLSPLSVLAVISLFLYLVGYIWCRKGSNGKPTWWYVGTIAIIVMFVSANFPSLTYILTAVFALAMVILFQTLVTDPVTSTQDSEAEDDRQSVFSTLSDETT